MLSRTAADIGAIVRRIRRLRGWTQAELAQRVGVTRSWIIRLEAGAGGVELALVLRTLAALELMVDLREVELDQLSATPGALDPVDTPVPLGEAGPGLVDLGAVLEALTAEVAPPGTPLAAPHDADRGP